MESLPRIIDNDRKSLLETIQSISNEFKSVSIATGYWNLEGMSLVIDHLEKFDSIRLLIGREPMIPRHNIVFPESDFPDEDFKFDLEAISPDSDNLDVARRTIEMIRDKKLEVKIYRGGFLHAKTYIFGNFNSSKAVGIIGSSNFTKSGLTENSELNQLESDLRIIAFKPISKDQDHSHLSWFENFWNHDDTENWDEKFLSILEHSPVGTEFFSPFETYIKTLYEIYGEELESEEDINLNDNSRILFDFQRKNVLSLIKKLQKNNVAMLSDSVGLGKTSTAIGVIKHYIENLGGKQRVEIICPKSLIPQWEKELAINDIYGFKPISLQNAAEIEARRELDHIASVSLFVIDESHNLRHANGKRFQQLLDWRRENPFSHVLLMTATPINNNLTDLSHQILLGTGGDEGVVKLTISDDRKQTQQVSFHKAIEDLRKSIKKDLQKNKVIDFDKIRNIMNPIIRNFVVRRTRQGIMREYGKLIINGEEKGFPQVVPEVLTYEFDKKNIDKIKEISSPILSLDEIYSYSPEQIADECRNLMHPIRQLLNLKKKEFNIEADNNNPMYFIFQLIMLLGFIPYRWMVYEKEFYGKTRDDVHEIISKTRLSQSEIDKLLQQLGIFGILRTVFLKRMESSVSALAVSLETYSKKLELFEQGLKKNEIHSVSNIDELESSLNDIDIDVPDEEAPQTLQKRVDSKSFHINEILEDILLEKELIRIIQEQLRIVSTDDTKLNKLVQTIEQITNENPKAKVLVFSYFSDTLLYLEREVFNKTKLLSTKNTGFVSSKSGTNAENLASRFSPIAKNYQFKEGEREIQFLFSTDILSEGQNLQDAGILINYDLHWNPVRMIQRNGRINRLGSEFEKVYVYNMKPENSLDSYLKLVQRLQGKIDMIRNTIGTDSSVLNEPENPIEFSDSIEEIYSENLMNRVKALEDAEKASDFLLSEDEYVFDLKQFYFSENYSNSYKQEVLNIPKGKWGVFPKTDNRGKERPRVLSLIKQTSIDLDANNYQFIEINPNNFTINSVQQLQALEWLKATAEENKRQPDNYQADRDKIKNHLIQYGNVFNSNVVTASLVGQQNDILKIMAQALYSEEVINIVRDGFKTNDVFQKKEMDKLKRRVMKLKMSNKNFQNELVELINLAKKINSQKIVKKDIEYSSSELQLIYVNLNE